MDEEEGENLIDLDTLQIDITRNFSIVTSQGCFSVHYLIERYVFEDVYPALTHYFSLKLPIKGELAEKFFREFFQKIQKATSFVSKPLHKENANALFVTIKKSLSQDQIKHLGADCLQNKSLSAPNPALAKQKKGIGNVPKLSQAEKLEGYLKSVKPDERLQKEFEVEFEELVIYVTEIDKRTKLAFAGMNTISCEEILEALIKISGVESDIDN